MGARDQIIIGLLAAVVVVLIVTMPDFKKTYLGAYLTGVCTTNPSAPECHPPRYGGGWFGRFR